MDMRLGEERRKHIRVFFPGGKVRIKSGQIFALVGKIIDISLGGIRFTTEADFAHGETITLEIVLVDGMKFKCDAKVVHLETISTQNACGASFLNLAQNDEKELGELVMSLRSQQDEKCRDERETE